MNLSAPSLLLLVGSLAASSQASAAAYFTFSGNFTQDDGRADFLFTIVAPATVELRSWSYAGGTDALGSVIPAGGFAPVLSLFDSGGNLLAFDRGGTVGGSPPNDCATGARAQDPTSGLCLDAYTQATLSVAGNYRVVITQQDNTPNGPTWSEGFVLEGTGDFTGGPFFDAGGNLRNSFFHFTLGPVVDAQEAPVPEPSACLSLVSGLALLLWKRRNRGEP